MSATYLHSVETDGSISGWFHAGTLTLDNRLKHIQGSTRML